MNYRIKALSSYTQNLSVSLAPTGENWTQGFWQNHVAHKDGNLYPLFNNTGSPRFKLNYTAPLYIKD